MRRRGSLLTFLLLLLRPFCEARAVRETERRLQEGIISTTGELTVIAGTDYCCSNGLSTASATSSTARRRNLNTQPHIGWSDPGDWVAYPFQLPSAGAYQVLFNVASIFGDGSFELVDMETQQVYGVVDTMPITNDWDTFETISLSVTLPAGLVSLQIRLLSAGWNLLWMAVSGGEQGGLGTIPVVIAPPPVPDVVVSPDEVTMAPSASAVDGTLVTSTMAPTVALALDDVTTLPTVSTTSLESDMPTPTTSSKPAPAMTPAVMPAPSTLITLSPVEKAPVISIPLPTPLVAPILPPNGGTTKPPPLSVTNKRPFLHQFITAENILRSSPTIVWETSDTEQRMQATELKAGDWMEFELAIPVAGPYQVHVRASSPSGEGAFELVNVVEADGMVARMTDLNVSEIETSLGTFTGFPATGTWDEYDRMDLEITLPASPAGSGLLMRIYILEPGFNLVWLYVEPSDLWDAVDARDDVN